MAAKRGPRGSPATSRSPPRRRRWIRRPQALTEAGRPGPQAKAGTGSRNPLGPPEGPPERTRHPQGSFRELRRKPFSEASFLVNRKLRGCGPLCVAFQRAALLFSWGRGASAACRGQRRPRRSAIAGPGPRGGHLPSSRSRRAETVRPSQSLAVAPLSYTLLQIIVEAHMRPCMEDSSYKGAPLHFHANSEECTWWGRPYST